MGIELYKNLTQLVLWAGVLLLTGLGGAGGGLLGRWFAGMKANSGKPSFGGENLSISVSKRWLIIILSAFGAVIGIAAFFLLFYTAVATELPSYL